MTNNKILIYELTYPEIESFIISNQFPKYRCGQIWEFLYLHKVDSFDEMTSLPLALRTLLEETFVLSSLTLVLKQESIDQTKKFLYGLDDQNLIETVLMNHDYGLSICVTSQVGCNIGCKFCASGIIKKVRDLTTGELVEQIIKTEKTIKQRISSVVVMGIGEPFDNYKNLVRFLSIINHPKGLAIGARHITVSTSGLVPRIKDFANLGIQVNLAVSLHAPFDEIRSELMPINQRFDLATLIEGIKSYIEVTNRRVTIEYILINEVNDTLACAHQLAKLLKGLNVYVNLIPYNEVKEVSYQRSTEPRRKAFYEVLRTHKITATLRREQGSDINAACGQLRSKHLT